MLSFNFKRMKDADLFTFSGGVIQRVTTDKQFGSLKLQVEALKKAYDAYGLALSAATMGGKDRLKERDDRRDALVLELNIVGKSVDVMARGKDNVLQDAGFELRKSTASKTLNIVAPPNFSVLNTERAGEVRLSWTGAEDALTYAIEQKLKEDATWKNGEYTSRREILLSGYEQGKCVEFRIRTLGRGESKSDWSSAVGVWVA